MWNLFTHCRTYLSGENRRDGEGLAIECDKLDLISFARMMD